MICSIVLQGNNMVKLYRSKPYSLAGTSEDSLSIII